jgi:hypothetical protein
MIKRALTLRNVVESDIAVFAFTGEWEAAFGCPQRTGVWFVYGHSGHGKTSFVLLLIKYLAEFGRVLYVSYEEGRRSLALKEGIRRLGLLSVNASVKICDDTLDELDERLRKRRSADVVVIDSLQYSEFGSIRQIRDFAGRFPNKLFVFTGHAKGSLPASSLGRSVLYYANQKIWVEGYRAFSRGRSMGEKEYLTVWDKGAEKYWKYK